jgi:hypothetical protein
VKVAFDERQANILLQQRINNMRATYRRFVLLLKSKLPTRD